MNAQRYGFESGNPAVSYHGISEVECVRRINVLISEIQDRKQRYGCRELFEFLIPDNGRIVHGNVFVRNREGKLVCLGTRKEVVEKGLRGAWK